MIMYPRCQGEKERERERQRQGREIQTERHRERGAAARERIRTLCSACVTNFIFHNHGSSSGLHEPSSNAVQLLPLRSASTLSPPAITSSARSFLRRFLSLASSVSSTPCSSSSGNVMVEESSISPGRRRSDNASERRGRT